MKLLHTSDLHLGEQWEGRDRKADEQRVLSEILNLCHQHHVELLLVAGDIFSDRPRGSLAAVARCFFQQLAPSMRSGLRVVLLRGNHDSLEFFRLLRLVCQEWLGEQGIQPIIADLPGVYDVPGTDVQVVALPYLAPNDLRNDGSEAASADERVVGLSGLLAQQLLDLYQRVEPGKSTIFAGHIMVRGAQLTSEIEFETGYHRELWITADTLPQFTSYNALGHIHLTQELTNVGKPTWYAGAPDRRNMGERHYQPQVLLVELPDQPGGVATVTTLPLTSCTPFVEQTLDSVTTMHAFCDEWRGQDPLGRVTLDIPYADRVESEKQIRAAAPRLDIAFVSQIEMPEATVDDIDYRDVVGTVQGFIERMYVDDAAAKARLLVGFERLWQEIEQ